MKVVDSLSTKSNTMVAVESELKTNSKILNGECKVKYDNGKIKIQGQMKDGKRDGIWKSFYENETPWSETTFENGIKYGKTTSWFLNGQKRYEGFYTNNQESGNWKFWNETGKLVIDKNYEIK